MKGYTSVATGLLVFFTCACSAQYLRTYPPKKNDTVPLYFGLMMSFGGGFNGSGVIGGVEVALDQINDDPTLLPGYTLHYTLTDSQCDRRVSLEKFFYQINNEPTKIAWLGSGCSPATEPTAELSHYYNITQVSCVSSSSELKNRQRFRYYFQMLVTDDKLALGFFGIIQRYKWRHVALIVQDENLFTVTMAKLKKLLFDAGVGYSERRFDTEEGIAGLESRLFDPEARIFILSMYEGNARNVLCEAYRKGLKYPTHLMLTQTWYGPTWWLKNDTDCTAEERESVLLNSIGTEVFEFISNNSAVADTGINGSTYDSLYNKHLEIPPLHIADSSYGPVCYDAMWVIAYALNQTLTELNENDTLREMAGRAAGVKDFKLEDTSYTNNIIAEVMFRNLAKTSFTGLTGNVSFGDQGIRQGGLLLARQYRRMEQSMNNTTMKIVNIGHIEGKDENTTLVYLKGQTEQSVWPDGLIPYDGVPNEEIVTVALPLTIIFAILATAGIVFTITCLIFNFVFRHKKLIRLASPKLNYFLGAGAILLYVDIYIIVIPTTDRTTAAVLCNVSPWLTSLGYSLCFGTVLVKMGRVYYIFHNPMTNTKKSRIHDWYLMLILLALLVVDAVILSLYLAVEGARGNLSATRVSNRENPIDHIGELKVIHLYYFYTCISEVRKITLGVLYGYKALLQVVSLLFAFQIRKVKVKGLNDARYTAATIYVTSIILAVTISSTYSRRDYVNVYPFVLGLGLMVGTTAILALVFIPKMIGVRKDPSGRTIYKKTDPRFSRNRAYSSQTKFRQKASQAVADVSTNSAALQKRIVELENALALCEKSSSTSDSQSSYRRSSGVSISTDFTSVIEVDRLEPIKELDSDCDISGSEREAPQAAFVNPMFHYSRETVENNITCEQ